jgi:hypothetical protein
MITRRTFLARTAHSAATLTATARAVAAVKTEALATADPALLEPVPAGSCVSRYAVLCGGRCRQAVGEPSISAMLPSIPQP